MRERDLRALEFNKVIGLVAAMAASEPGRAAVQALRPADEPAEVATRLRAAAEMVALRGHAGALPMGEFADQRTLLLAAAREGAVLDGASLVKVRDFVLAARHVGAFMRSRVERLPHLAALAQNLIAPKELADALLGALADDGGLLDEASPQLARLRERLRAERVELEARLMRSLSGPGMEPFVSDYLVTVRNHRFVLPLKLNYAERLEGIVQDRSVSGETLFVEPMWAVELNNRLMMLERDVEAEELRILAHLTAMIRGYGTELRLTFDAMVALDALNARARFAERFRCVEPVIVEADQGGFELIEARHPLLIAGGREAVPIDVRIAPGMQGIVISGPNTGGKTVALKTIGLLALMAQAGLLIPAREGSRLTVFRSIFADIGDEQSIEANLSSFAAHIVNLREMAEAMREPALVILDEPGEGTDPVEGAALAIGLMTWLGRRRCLVAIATHTAAIKLHAYSRAGYEAAAVDFDPEHLQPLYRLKPHTIGQSYGLAVAERLGLPAEIVAAARAAMPAGTAELERALKLLEEERARLRDELERIRERERAAAARAAEAEEKLERALRRTEAERARVAAEGRELVVELRREGAALAEEIRAGRKARREMGALAARAAARVEQLAPARAEAEERPEARAPLSVGDQVEFGDIRGELIALGEGRAVIGRGGLRIEVAPERLRRVSGRAEHGAPKVMVSAGAGEFTDGGELNLIGMRTSEALRKLEEFLDQAYLTNRSEVRIVHGIGSGALKKAVHEYLAGSPYCAGFRQAEPHQGGAGATIVQLNL
ncbi:MAG TPA: endonuclease MutS2 [Candidatus Binataceae bacterium]|nr:endonuclease MutS2 [Candidatus Binataceae bacterium]